MSDAKYFTTTKKGMEPVFQPINQSMNDCSSYAICVLFESFLTVIMANHFRGISLGEIFELKSELNSDKKEKRREAVKKSLPA